MAPKFISFCGIDGSGKTTQAQMLVKYFNRIGAKVVHIHGFKPYKYSSELKKIANETNNSFNDLFSNDIRTVSFILDLLDVTMNTVLPALKEDCIVIAEKYFLDTKIYAPLLGTNRKIIELFNNIVPVPDLYILLNISAEESICRIKKRAKIKNIEIAPKESIDIAYKAQQEFMLYCEKHKENCTIIDAERDIQSIHLQIKKTVNNIIF